MRTANDVGSGALGISRETCADCRNAPWTATSAPPAEMFRAEANSRKSFPLRSRLRIKRGMRRGNRVQARRSGCVFCRTKRFGPLLAGCTSLPHLSCQTIAAARRKHQSSSDAWPYLRAVSPRFPLTQTVSPIFNTETPIIVGQNFGKSLPKRSKSFAFFVDTRELRTLAF